MKENIEQMWCGDCGGKEYRVYFDRETRDILTECQSCKIVSVIQVEAKLIIKSSDDDQNGNMTSDNFKR